MNFYNDICKDACDWTQELIRNGLIPDGTVSDTPIQEIKPHELRDFTQAHFFSGVAGWPLAFQLAGISPDENADSGSCPCQPFSGTGKQLGFADPRHLWPAFRRVILRRQPATVYGEQVASKLGREWLSRVFSDLAYMGYSGAGADLCSAGVGSPNIRQRLFWVGYAMRLGRGEGQGQSGEVQSSRSREFEPTESGRNCGMEHAASDGRQQRGSESDGRSVAGGRGVERLANTNGQQTDPANTGGLYAQSGCGGIAGGVANSTSERLGETRNPGGGEAERISGGCPALRLGHADHARREGRLIRWDGGYERATGAPGMGMWSDADLIFCRDGKWRRIEPGSFPLAHGIPSRVGPLLTELRKLGRSSIALARANRNIRLKGYGNAINPFVAARFIAAHREARRTGAGNLVRRGAPEEEV